MAYKRLGTDTRKVPNKSGKRYYFFSDSGKPLKKQKYYSVKKAERTRREKIEEPTGIYKPVEIPERSDNITEFFNEVSEKFGEEKVLLKLSYYRKLTEQEKKNQKAYKRTKKKNENYRIDYGISRRKFEYEIHKMVVPISEIDSIIREYAFDFSKGYHFNATANFFRGKIDLKNDLIIEGEISKPAILRNFQFVFDKRTKKFKKLPDSKIPKQFEKEYEVFLIELNEILNDILKKYLKNQLDESEEPELIL